MDKYVRERSGNSGENTMLKSYQQSIVKDQIIICFVQDQMHVLSEGPDKITLLKDGSFRFFVDPFF